MSFGLNKTTTTGYGTSATGTGLGTSSTSTFGKTGTTGFGTQAKQPTYQAQLAKDPLFDRLWNVRSAYDPSSPGYKFCYVFYNKRTSDQQPKCPANMEIKDWVKIMEDCPDPEHLVPTAIYGFEALHKRVEAQKAIEKELSQRMTLIQSKLREMTSFYATELCGSLERIKQNTTIISQLMMEVVEKEEVKRNQGNNLNDDERRMLNKLEQQSLDLNRPGMFNSAISNIRIKSQMMKDRQKQRSQMSVDRETLKSLAEALKNNQDAIEALESTTKKAKRVVDTLDSSISDLQ